MYSLSEYKGAIERRSKSASSSLVLYPKISVPLQFGMNGKHTFFLLAVDNLNGQPLSCGKKQEIEGKSAKK